MKVSEIKQEKKKPFFRWTGQTSLKYPWGGCEFQDIWCVLCEKAFSRFVVEELERQTLSADEVSESEPHWTHNYK